MLKNNRTPIFKNPRNWIVLGLIVIILGSTGFIFRRELIPLSMVHSIKLAIHGTPTPTPLPTAYPTFAPFPTRTPVPLTDQDAVLIGAGDIVMCGDQGSAETAAIIERFPGAAVFAAGDTANNKGKPDEYRLCVSKTWG